MKCLRWIAMTLDRKLSPNEKGTVNWRLPYREDCGFVIAIADILNTREVTNETDTLAAGECKTCPRHKGGLECSGM